MSSNLTSLNKSKAAQLLADRTRRADLDTADFSSAYEQLGVLLGSALAERLDVEPYDMRHCEGVRKGVRVKNEKSICIIVLLRAGLYLGEGLRIFLRNSPLFLVKTKRGIGMSNEDLESLAKADIDHAVIVDAVVNTGASIIPIFRQLNELGIKQLTVVAGVANVDKATKLAKEYPEVHFLYARLSSNSYVGSRGTDTGNRLFGTEFLE
jgi:uracil phosphoribosyltransferase